MSFKSRQKRIMGIDFRDVPVKVVALDIKTLKVLPEIYLNMAQKFCKRRKGHRKARWLHKFSRYLTRVKDKVEVI